jgi:hemin uptake protein HemP
MNADQPLQNAHSTHGENPSSTTPPVRNLAQLLGAGRELHILHDGAVYRLRLTANNKLILTK